MIYKKIISLFLSFVILFNLTSLSFSQSVPRHNPQQNADSDQKVNELVQVLNQQQENMAPYLNSGIVDGGRIGPNIMGSNNTALSNTNGIQSNNDTSAKVNAETFKNINPNPVDVVNLYNVVNAGNINYIINNKVLDDAIKNSVSSEDLAIATRLGADFKEFKKDLSSEPNINLESAWKDYVKRLVEYDDDYHLLIKIFANRQLREVKEVIRKAESNLKYFKEGKGDDKVTYEEIDYNAEAALHAGIHNIVTRTGTGDTEKGIWVWSGEHEQEFSFEKQLDCAGIIYNIISEYGYHPEDRQNIWKFAHNIVDNGSSYFDNDFHLVPDVLVISDKEKDKRDYEKEKRERQANRLSMAIAMLPLVSSSEEEKTQATNAIYGLMQDVLGVISSYDYAPIAVLTGARALIEIDTEESLNALYDFLTEDCTGSFLGRFAEFCMGLFSLEEWAKKLAKATDIVVPLWDGFEEASKSIFDGIREGASSFWDGLTDAGSSLWDGITDAGASLWDGITDSNTSFFDGLAGAANYLGDGFKTASKSLSNHVEDAIDSVSDGFKEGIESIKNGILEGGYSYNSSLSFEWSYISTSREQTIYTKTFKINGNYPEIYFPENQDNPLPNDSIKRSSGEDMYYTMAWYADGAIDKDFYNVIYTNIFEEIGRNLGERTHSSAQALNCARKLARKLYIDNFNRSYKDNDLTASVVVGILATATQDPDLIVAANMIYNGHWWDLNEATQTSKNNIAAAYLGRDQKEYDEKKEKTYSFLMGVQNEGKYLDVGVNAIMIGLMVVDAPAILRSIINFPKRTIGLMKSIRSMALNGSKVDKVVTSTAGSIANTEKIVTKQNVTSGKLDAPTAEHLRGPKQIDKNKALDDVWILDKPSGERVLPKEEKPISGNNTKIKGGNDPPIKNGKSEPKQIEYKGQDPFKQPEAKGQEKPAEAKGVDNTAAAQGSKPSAESTKKGNSSTKNPLKSELPLTSDLNAPGFNYKKPGSNPLVEKVPETGSEFQPFKINEKGEIGRNSTKEQMVNLQNASKEVGATINDAAGTIGADARANVNQIYKEAEIPQTKDAADQARKNGTLQWQNNELTYVTRGNWPAYPGSKIMEYRGVVKKIIANMTDLPKYYSVGKGKGIANFHTHGLSDLGELLQDFFEGRALGYMRKSETEVVVFFERNGKYIVMPIQENVGRGVNLIVTAYPVESNLGSLGEQFIKYKELENGRRVVTGLNLQTMEFLNEAGGAKFMKAVERSLTDPLTGKPARIGTVYDSFNIP